MIIHFNFFFLKMAFAISTKCLLRRNAKAYFLGKKYFKKISKCYPLKVLPSIPSMKFFSSFLFMWGNHYFRITHCISEYSFTTALQRYAHIHTKVTQAVHRNKKDQILPKQKKNKKKNQDLLNSYHTAPNFFYKTILLSVDIGIKHGFSFINTLQVARVVLKTEAGGRGFQHLPRDLANVNALKNHDFVRSLLLHKD